MLTQVVFHMSQTGVVSAGLALCWRYGEGEIEWGIDGWWSGQGVEKSVWIGKSASAAHVIYLSPLPRSLHRCDSRMTPCIDALHDVWSEVHPLHEQPVSRIDQQPSVQSGLVMHYSRKQLIR